MLGLCFPAMIYAQAVDLGTIRRGADREVIPIRTLSDNAGDAATMEIAFSMHGAFRLAGADESAVTLELVTLGGRLGYDLSLARSGRAFWKQRFSGASRYEALRKGLDGVVRELTGAPGFFNGKIAFMGELHGKTELFAGDVFFQDLKQLTRDGSLAVNPRWEPNGESLLYTSFHRNGFPDIFRIQLDAMKRDVFASYKGTNTGARFSPSGDRVAMVLSSPGNPEIFVANAQGENIRRLTRNPSVEASPSWSPDGRQLVFTSDAFGKPQLYLMDSSGGDMKRLPTNISGYCAEPDWNHRQPNLIAFTAAQGGGFQIAVYDFKTRSSTFISRVSGDAVEPVWMGDGRHLLFTHRQGDKRTLTILDSLTGKTFPLRHPVLSQSYQGDFLAP